MGGPFCSVWGDARSTRSELRCARVGLSAAIELPLGLALSGCDSKASNSSSTPTSSLREEGSSSEMVLEEDEVESLLESRFGEMGVAVGVVLTAEAAELVLVGVT